MVLRYTRDELFAIRATIEVENFSDPIDPNCPMHTDSNLHVNETIVRKHLKSTIGRWRPPPVIGGDLSPSKEDHPDVTKSYSLGDDEGPPAVIRLSSMMPPRLDKPIVKIGASRRLRHPVGVDEVTRVNVEAERKMMARVRDHQLRLKHEEGQQDLGQPQEDDRGHSHVNPQQFSDTAQTQKVEEMHSILKALTQGVPAPTVDELGTFGDSAVPIMNVSQFKSILTRRIRPHSYGPHLMRQPLFPWPLPLFTCRHAKGHSGVADTNLNTAQTRSLGPEDSGAVAGKSEGSAPLSSTGKRKHRRRTNRTHAQKREFRQRQAVEFSELNCAYIQDKDITNN